PPADYVDPNIGVSPLGPSNPDNIIAPFWADLDPTPRQLSPAVDPTIFYQGIGSAPNRRFIAQWNNVPIFGTQTLNTFQVVLHESSGAIEFIYKTMGNQGSLATIGLEDPTGQRVRQFSSGVSSLSNNLVLTWTPAGAELRRLTFQARVVAPAWNGATLTNTATVAAGDHVRQASASLLVGPVPQARITLYLPRIGK
ncbi:MAG TPA: hypothetical protein VD886_22160, partial [Herpetosiphonaceae bacterium]|nr:hypothetical protein [Herpetosiphonaceae bacterium]